MPNKDGTGPDGTGKRTGRGKGNCKEGKRSVTENSRRRKGKHRAGDERNNSDSEQGKFQK